MNPPILAQKLTSDCGKIFRNTELPPWREITPQLVSRTTNHHHKYINSQKNCHHHDHHHRYDHHHHHHHHHHHQQNHCQNLLICGPSLPNAICITIVQILTIIITSLQSPGSVVEVPIHHGNQNNHPSCLECRA